MIRSGTLYISLLQLSQYYLTAPVAAFIPNNHQFSSLVLTRSSNNASSQSSQKRNMGLYDEPIPEPPKDWTKNRMDREGIRKQRKKFIKDSDYLAEEKDEDGNIIFDDLDGFSSSLDDDDDEIEKLFSFNDVGDEVNDLLPSLGRNMKIGIPCYFEPTDKKAQIVADKASCNIEDACWALEAHKGDIVESVISISMARRKVLNESVALPGKEEVENTDWDGELKSLLSSSTKKLGDDEFENDANPIGFDGTSDERQIALERRRFRKAAKNFMKSEKDQQWLPKENPKPIDDEPWFTG